MILIKDTLHPSSPISQPNGKQTHRRWTDADVLTLEDNYSDMTNASLAALLGRTERAVVFKAYQLKLKRAPVDLNDEEFASFLGVDPREVRRWVADGWLRRTAPGGRIGKKDFHRLLRLHPLALRRLLVNVAVAPMLVDWTVGLPLPTVHSGSSGDGKGA